MYRRGSLRSRPTSASLRWPLRYHRDFHKHRVNSKKNPRVFSSQRPSLTNYVHSHVELQLEVQYSHLGLKVRISKASHLIFEVRTLTKMTIQFTLEFAMPQAPRPRKFTRYCFTINNYDRLSDVARLKQLRYKYIILGFERGESGTPHIQGFVVLSKQMRLSEVKRFMPRAHIEPANGTDEQASSYCKKEGDFWEDGELPKSSGQATKVLWDKVYEKAKQGHFDWIIANYPKLWIIHGKRLQELEAPSTSPLDGELLHEWWVGDTGVGKSRLLWELYPTHFQKETNKWWDGYERSNSVVAIEEWSPKNECTASFLKIWADRYPFTGQVKGATILKIRPRKIIVLSNYTIEQCFPASQDCEPLLRRFTVLTFPRDAEAARERALAFNEEQRVIDSVNSLGCLDIVENEQCDVTTSTSEDSDHFPEMQQPVELDQHAFVSCPEQFIGWDFHV